MLAERTLPTLRMFLQMWKTDEAFLEAHDCPFLLVSAADDRLATASEPTESHSILWFSPNVQEWHLQVLESLVLPVRKRDGANAFSSLVTIGRSPNNDLILPFKGISKFHAYFTYDGGWLMWDAKSRNGTSIQGRQLQKASSASVTEQDVIHLGEHEARFLIASGMLDLMRELRPHTSA